jgi:hypothetical protein
LGLFDKFKLSKNKKDTGKSIYTPDELKHPKEPEFLKKLDIEAEREIENGESSNEKRDEAEPELALWLSNGLTVKNLKELSTALKKIKIREFREHVNDERNDIAEWVREVLNNDELADRIKKAKSKIQAAKYIESEIKRNASAKKKVVKDEKAVLPKKTSKKNVVRQLAPPPLPMSMDELEKSEEEFDLPEIRTNNEGRLKRLLPFGRKKLTELGPEDIGLPDIEEGAESAEFEPQHENWPEEGEKEKAVLVGKEREEAKREIEAALKKVSKEEVKKGRKEEKSHAEVKISRKEEELRNLDNELSSEEQSLNSKRIDLTRRRYELIQKKGALEKEKFEEFMNKHKRVMKEDHDELIEKESPSDLSVDFKGMPHFKLSGVYSKERLKSLLEEVKQHINQNNVDEAKKTLSEIQSVFSTTYMPNKEKKQIEYDILEIEADLKLASLS